MDNEAFQIIDRRGAANAVKKCQYG